MSCRTTIVAVIPITLLSFACGTAAPPTGVEAACADVFQAEVCTWETVHDGALVEFGATVPLAAIEHAPADAPMTWPPVPAATIELGPATRQRTGLTQLTMGWESGGHPPRVFMTPHFDFHFYTMPAAAVNAIDCADLRKPASPPAGYTLPDIPLPPEMAGMMGVSTLVGLCVPKMGMHAIAQREIDRTDVFDGTMVVGYYEGQPIFIEPMISKAMLMQQASFDLPMPVVPGFTGSLPSRFHAEYLPAERSYRFVLSGFGPAS